MRQVVTKVVATCDWCDTEVLNESDLVTRTFAVEGKPYEIDFCPADDEAWLTYALDDLIARARKMVGALVKKKKQHHQSKAERAENARIYAILLNARTGMYECPEGTCEGESNSKNGLAVHVSRIHGKKIGDYNL